MLKYHGKLKNNNNKLIQIKLKLESLNVKKKIKPVFKILWWKSEKSKKERKGDDIQIIL